MRNTKAARAGLAVALLAGALEASAADMRTTSFPSPSLGRPVSLTVQLPPSYASHPERRYPVLYVLHGLFEDDHFWERRGLAAVVEGKWAAGTLSELVVAAVDGGNSFFVNGPLGRYEDLVTKDAVEHVESTYRVVKGRAGRGLAGISMGGYAALRIAFAHPEAFRVVAAHSAMLLTQVPSAAEGAGRWHMAAFASTFGKPIDAALWAANDPLALADRVDPAALPALYFDCGAQDRYGLYAGNEELHRRLERRKVAHEFGLHPGNHGYEFVRSVLGHSLEFVGAALSPER